MFILMLLSTSADTRLRRSLPVYVGRYPSTSAATRLHRLLHVYIGRYVSTSAALLATTVKLPDCRSWMLRNFLLRSIKSSRYTY